MRLRLALFLTVIAGLCGAVTAHVLRGPDPAAPAVASGTLAAPPPGASPPAAAAAGAVQASAGVPAQLYPAPAPAPDWQATLATADVGRGRAVMAAGLGRGEVPACTSCHGVNGEPVAGSNVPRLSGQSAWYLAKQLSDYADGRRRNPMMTGYARTLTPQQRADVALAWAGRGAPYAPPREPPAAEALDRGRTLVAAGDDALALPACSNCHWNGAPGANAPIPYIGGQHPDYTLAALQDWADGRRANDTGGVMRAVVGKLTPDDRRAVAAYLATMPPPSPAPR